MAEDGSRNPFSSFWKRSADKPPSKEFVFLPPNETRNKSDRRKPDNEESDVTSNQLRRAQVRKAQTEHRLRKKNYVKHLEQDVINLRKKIATVHGEAASLQTENDSIKATIWGNDLSNSTLPVVGHRKSNRRMGVYGKPLPLPSSFLEQRTSYQDVGLCGMSVTIDFDSTIDTSCLQAHHSSPKRPEILINTPTMFNFPSNAFTGGNSGNYGSELLEPVPSCPHQARLPLDLKTAETAINFILALEHPCRTHFGPIPEDFSPKGSATGHELMASTSLYAHAPSYVFANFSETVWDSPLCPITELQKLREMNESLPKRDSEITPVQAWFLLAEKYELDILLENESLDRRDNAQGKRGFLEQLKMELSTLVDCFGFGAAMDRIIFWEAVERVGAD